MTTTTILFLCTGNSARSILAEALLNARGGNRFQAFSAGSRPVGRVNPLAIETLKAHGISTDGLRSKSWDEFAAASAPALDIIITVCDSAAKETCPIWPGHPATAHWGVPDPAVADRSEKEQRQAFEQTFADLDAAIQKLVSIKIDTTDRAQLQTQLQEIAPEAGTHRS